MTPSDGTDTPTADPNPEDNPSTPGPKPEAKKVNPAIPKIEELIAQLEGDKSVGAQNAVGLLKGAKTWLEKA